MKERTKLLIMLAVFENKKMSRTMDILRKGAGAVIVLVGVYFSYRGLS